MSQVITNKQGEHVEVLDRGDLSALQSKLLWAVAGSLVVFAGLVWRVSAQVTNYENRITQVEVTIRDNIPNMRAMQRTMDSLLIELRFMRQEIERTR